MKVSEIMSTHLKTVAVDTPMSSVVADMCLYRVSGLPVVEEGNRLVGFIAEKDVLHYLFPSLEDAMNLMLTVDWTLMEKDYRNILQLKVADLMTKNVITVSPDMEILKATSVMVRHRFRRIPVAVGDTLVGMLSLGDVHKALFKQAVATGH